MSPEDWSTPVRHGGLYELEEGADPDPAVYAGVPDTTVSARVAAKATVSGKGRKRTVSVVVDADEPLSARMELRRANWRVGLLARGVAVGRTVLKETVTTQRRSFTAKVALTLTDAAGNRKTIARSVRIRGR